MLKDYYNRESDFSPQRVLKIYKNNPQKNEVDAKKRFNRPAYFVKGNNHEQEVDKQYEADSSQE